ncbi:hypothetical protein ABKN59_001327 [Abortiporus biennis]
MLFLPFSLTVTLISCLHGVAEELQEIPLAKPVVPTKCRNHEVPWHWYISIKDSVSDVYYTDIDYVSQFADSLDKMVAKLNSSPKNRLFEVGPSGTLLGGDIFMASLGPEHELEAVIHGVKPGIWGIKNLPQDDPFEYKGTLLRWLADGHLDYNDLPTSLSLPQLSPLSQWKQLVISSVDSGTQGILDNDSLEVMLAEAQREDPETDMEYILDMLAEYSYSEGNLAVKAGYVIASGDGFYQILGRSHGDSIVELLTKPYHWDE